MPVYFYWGEDDFAIAKAVAQLKEQVIDPDWAEFNLQTYLDDSQENVIAALNDAMTPPFGTGGRLVWLQEATIANAGSNELLTELERTLDQVSDNCHLLFTSRKKPDGRLKTTKLLQKTAQVREFSPIPYWDESAIQQNIRQTAQEIGIKLAPSAIAILQEYIGSDNRRLWNELEKLSIYQAGNSNLEIDGETVAQLVVCNTQNSLKLAQAMRDSNSEIALSLLYDLLAQNEPPLKIVATLVGQFRLWLMVKVAIEAQLTESGNLDYKAIAKIADLKGNPNRLRYILKDLQHLTVNQLIKTLPLLLELEYALKTGADPQQALITGVTKICLCLKSSKSSNKSTNGKQA